MTGVIEGAIVVGLFGGGGLAVKNVIEASEQEKEDIAKELYSKHFKGDITAKVTDARSHYILATLPDNLDPYAVASIRVIENYQREREKKSTWEMITKAGPVADTRGRVCEELKQWFLEVKNDGVDSTVVATRLEYVYQYLLRPFGKYFLTVMAEVSTNLDALLKKCIERRTTDFQGLGEIVTRGKSIADASLSTLLFSLPAESAIPGRASRAGVGEAPYASGVSAFVERIQQMQSTSPDSQIIDASTDVGRLLVTLLTTGHFRKLASSDDQVIRRDAVQQPSGVFKNEVDRVRAAWTQTDALPATCGLMPVFCDKRYEDARGAYITLVDCLDRIVFFSVELRPYHQLSAHGGDCASVKLRKMLAHMLQELEKAVVELRQARLQLTNVAKQRLQDLAKSDPFPSSGSEDYRWMQCLRYLDAADADASFQDIVTRCAKIRATLTAERALDLEKTARKELENLAVQFTSVEMQARMRRLPARVEQDMKVLQDNLHNAPAQQALTF